MAQTAGALEVIMFSGIARLQADMAAHQRTVSGAMKSIESAVSSAKNVLATLGVGVSVHLLIAKIESVTESMDTLGRKSEITGASVENLSKLQFFAGTAKSNIGEVTAALGKLSSNMIAVDNEGAAASQALKFLNLSAKDENGNLKTADLLYGEIAKKLSEYSAGAGKNAIARALMGKAGADQIPIMKKMIELGDIEAAVTTEQATAASAYQLEVARLNQQKEILWNTVVSALLPSMQSFVGVLLDASQKTDSLGSKTKELAADKSIENWADAGALGVARLIDVIKIIPQLLSAVGSSFEVVYADLKVLAMSSVLTNPIALGAAIAAGTNPWDNFKNSLDERNTILAEANAKYEALWKAEGNATEKAMQKSIEDRKSFNKFMEGITGDALDEAMFGGAESLKKLNFALVDTKAAARLAAAELKLYEGAVKRLSDELGRLNNQSEGEKLAFEMRGREYPMADGSTVHLTGSLEKLSEAHKKLLPLLAAETDKRTGLLLVSKLTAESYEAMYVAQQKTFAIQTATFQGDKDYLDDLRFQIDLIGKTRIEQEKMNEVRRIDLKLQSDLRSAADAAGDNMAQFDAARDAMLKAAEDQKTAVLGSVAARLKAERDWVTGANAAFDEYIDHATNAAEQSRIAFTNAFRGLEDALFEFIRHGTFGIKDFVGLIKDQFARLAAQRITLNIVGQVGGALGIPGTAGASSSGGGIMDLFSGASSANNLFGGNSFFTNLLGGGTAAATVGGTGLLASGVGVGLSTGVGLALPTAASGGLGLVAGTSTLAPALSAIGTGAPAIAATGFSAAIPYVGAALMAAQMLGLFGDDDAPSHQGVADLARRFDASGKETWRGSSIGDGSGGVNLGGGVESILAGMNQGYLRAAMSLGITAAESQFAYGASSLDGKMSGFSVAGGVGSSQYLSGDIGSYSDEALATEAARAVLAALQGSELPPYLQKFFSSLVPEALDKTAIDNALAFAASLKQLRSELMYTPAELAAQQIEQLNKALDTSVDTTEVWKTSFMAAIEGGLGPEAVAQWQALGAAITQAADIAAAAAAEIATAMQAAQADRLTAEGNLRAAYQREVTLQQERVAAVTAAQAALRQAYQSQVSELEGTAKSWQDAATSLRAYRDHLLATTGSPVSNYAELDRQFTRVSTAAQLGDKAAVAQLQSVSESFREAALANSSTELDYIRVVARIQRALEATIGVADRQSTIAEKSLTTLKAQQELLLGIDAGVLTVEQAIANLQTAQAAEALGASELALMTTQVSALITIGENVLSVEQAIRELWAATARQVGVAGGGTVTGAAATERFIATSTGQAWVSSAGAVATMQTGQAIGDAIIHAIDGSAFTVAQAQQFIQDRIATNDIRAIYDAEIATGISFASANVLAGLAAGTAEAYVASQGWARPPGFAAGGVPDAGWAMFGEEGPEMGHFDGRTRLYSAEQTRGMFSGSAANDELLARVDRLCAAVERLEQPAKDTADATSRHKDLAEQTVFGDFSVRTTAA